MEPLPLSYKANSIVNDFRSRCVQSAKQGLRFCDTASIVEDHQPRVTPIEDTYIFPDKSEADVVLAYLRSTLRDDAFTNYAVNVEPSAVHSGKYHIHIHANWR